MQVKFSQIAPAPKIGDRYEKSLFYKTTSTMKVKFSQLLLLGAAPPPPTPTNQKKKK
jgi:hypothetical protein